MKKLLLILSILLSITLNSQTSQEVGVTDGQLAVSLTGAATYSIPILVPPGINGVEPKVSLNYNSQSGSGIAGYGWNILGVSAITRIASTKFHDNLIDGVDFDENDRFALDGQRLILKSGIYGGDNAIYETENYSNLKIVSYGVSSFGSNYGPAYFKVFYPDGSQAHFGTTSDSKTRSVWAIARWHNPQNLRISYQYVNLNNSLHLGNIRYGSKGDVAGINRINFHYHGKTRKEEAYINGHRHLNNRILKRIKTYSGTDTYRTYQLHHDNTSLNYERLIKITEKVREGSIIKELNPTTFNYDDSNSADSFTHTVTQIGLNNVSYTNTNYISGDFNEDGKMDVITYHTSGSNTRKNFTLFRSVQNDNFNNGITYNFGNSVNGFASLQSAKILYQNKLRSGWIGIDNYSLGQGILKYTKFIFENNQIIQVGNPTSLGSGTGKKTVVAGDFNGDAITDLLVLKKFHTTDVWLGTTHIGNIDEVLSTGSYASIQSRVYTGDYNGDGKTDIYILRENKLKVYSLNSQNNYLIKIAEIFENDIDLNKPCLFGDYNGDGKTDFVIPEANYQDNWNFYFSNASSGFIKRSDSIGLQYTESYTGNAISGCAQLHNAIINRNYFSSDINNDGKTDILFFSNDSYRNNGSNVSSIFQIAKNTGTNSTNISFNTNTIAQSVLYCHSGISKNPVLILLNGLEKNQSLEFAVISNNKIHRFNNEKNHRQDVLLRSITNGNGVKESISYEPLIEEFSPEGIPIYYKRGNTSIAL